MFRAQNLSFFQGGKFLLKKMTFNVPLSGSITTIIGPNGAGKTTLLKMLAGLIRPTGGVLKRPVQKRIGYMPQNFSVSYFLPLDVTTFLDLTPNAIASGQEMLERYRQSSLASKFLYTLSLGERQKILFLKALMHSPDVLILDEPTQGLDIAAEASFYEWVRRLSLKEKISIIMASHDLHTVFRESSFILCVNQTLCCSGSPDHVQENANYQKLFTEQVSSKLKPYVHTHT